MQIRDPVYSVLSAVILLALLLGSGTPVVVSAPIPPGGAVRRDKDTLVGGVHDTEVPQQESLLTPSDSSDTYEVRFVGTVVDIPDPGYRYDVQVQQVISGTLPGQVEVWALIAGGPCLGFVDPAIEIGDLVEVHGFYHESSTLSVVDVCGSPDYYIAIVVLPDFEIPTLAWSTATPEVMEGTQLQVQIRNSGDDYDSSMGDVDVQLRLWGTGIEDEWLWIFPAEIDQLAGDHSVEHTVDLLFTSEDIDRFEVCVNFDGAESDLSNNCMTGNITVEPPAESWRSCAGMAVNAVDILIGKLPVDEAYEGIKEISRIFAMHVPSMMVECQEVDDSCMDAVLSFLEDSAFTMAELLAESTLLEIFDLGKGLIEQFSLSVECGEYLATVVRSWVENARHRNVEVNAAVAESPVYVTVVDFVGQRAGYLGDGSPVVEIPGAEVFDVGGQRAILYPGADTASVELSAIETGAFSLILSVSRSGAQGLTASRSASGAEVHTVTYVDVPVTADTTGEIDVASGQYTLALDDDGDGTTDRNIQPTEEIRTHIYWVYLPLAVRNRSD